MIISFNWLREYLPADTQADQEFTDPEKISKMLTAIGLEVEKLEKYEEVKGGLKGLIVGEVISCEKHPDADKLKLTNVSTNNGKMLQIVCGATNVAVGQKVVVAPIGSTIFHSNGTVINIKKAKIRGIESEGMICAEDEIGLGSSHEGIMILPENSITGMAVADLLKPAEDYIFEIGLTPNRIDAMSHIGVAKDLCAYLSHQKNKEIIPCIPQVGNFKPDTLSQPVKIDIEDSNACRRFSGISLKGITVATSPEWLQKRLKSIGVKPINNIVDITNFMLHESGQPLHAYDADTINGNQIMVRQAKAGETFVTLDNKTLKLNTADILVCDEKGGMCLAGVYGGVHSAVSNSTKNIFLESAWFNPENIRKTSLQHALRTDAAARFEKGTDISNCLYVLKRAALLIKEIAGGEISSEVIDIYPHPLEKKTVGLKNHYLKKLSGKHYHSDTIKKILKNLGFEILKEGSDEIWVEVPYSKPDISLPADIVEEIMRIDGLDNIEIPSSINITPSSEKNSKQHSLKNKLADYLTGQGFYEIFCNSITNSEFYSQEKLDAAVKMINSLSSELNILRPEMLQGGLQVIAHNLNRKNQNLRFFEFGKTYSTTTEQKHIETGHLTLFISGNQHDDSWNQKMAKSDFYLLKAVVENILLLTAAGKGSFEPQTNVDFNELALIKCSNTVIGSVGTVSEKTLKQFDIKQPVYYADLLWDALLDAGKDNPVRYKEVSKYPIVSRDLALVVDKSVTYASIEEIAAAAQINTLTSVKLFDVFESDKLGPGKKSMAVSFTFSDDHKTLTDGDIDSFMQTITSLYEKKLNALIRK